MLVLAKLKSPWLGPPWDPGYPVVGKMGEVCGVPRGWRFHFSALPLLGVYLESVASSVWSSISLMLKWHSDSTDRQHHVSVSSYSPTVVANGQPPRCSAVIPSSVFLPLRSSLPHRLGLTWVASRVLWECCWWLLRPGHERQCCFHPGLSWITALGGHLPYCEDTQEA